MAEKRINSVNNALVSPHSRPAATLIAVDKTGCDSPVVCLYPDPSRVVTIVNRLIRSPLRSAPARASTDFQKSEDGSLTIFGLVVFVMMMIGAGIALDVMRSEVQRTELQYAIDRAVLAAAGLDQTRDSGDVVKDYVRAAGLDDSLVNVTSTVNGMDRRVAVTAEATTRSLFLDLLGIDELVQPVSTEAREVRTELELSLVVDISGSMGGAKIQTLRTAATDFVDELLDGREDLTTISLVPYNDRVNAGTLVSGVFDVTTEHPFSNCFVFSDAEYQRLDQAPNTRIQRMGHFDFRTYYTEGNEGGLVPEPNCRTDNYAAILPWSNNVSELHSRIAALDASHWTAMDLGVKWGTLLLDPSSRDELTELTTSPDATTAERVDPIFVGRPVDYNSIGTHKVLVVMTDGVNTQQWDLKPSRKSGNSGMYVYREALNYVCRNYERNRYYSNGSRRDGLSHADGALCDAWDSSGRPAPTSGLGLSLSLLGINLDIDLFGQNGSGCGTINTAGRIVGSGRNNTPGDGTLTQAQRQRIRAIHAACRGSFDSTDGNRYAIRYSVWTPQANAYWIDHLNQYWSSPYGGSNAIRLTWQELLGSVPLNYIANNIMSGSNYDNRVDYFYSWETTHGQTRADNNLSRACAAARAQGIVIYTIAFQAPPEGQAAMRDCAGEGNESRYFDVVGLNIAQAFDDVLASVSRLRLIQ